MGSTRWQYDSYMADMHIMGKAYPLMVTTDETIANAPEGKQDDLRALQLAEQKIKAAVCRSVESSLHSDYFFDSMEIIGKDIIGRGKLTKEEIASLSFSIQKFDKTEPDLLLQSVEEVGYKSILLKKLALRDAGLVFTKHSTVSRSRTKPTAKVTLPWENR